MIPAHAKKIAQEEGFEMWFDHALEMWTFWDKNDKREIQYFPARVLRTLKSEYLRNVLRTA